MHSGDFRCWVWRQHATPLLAWCARLTMAHRLSLLPVCLTGSHRCGENTKLSHYQAHQEQHRGDASLLHDLFLPSAVDSVISLEHRSAPLALVTRVFSNYFPDILSV
jgi:hypothetical protein